MMNGAADVVVSRHPSGALGGMAILCLTQNPDPF